MKQPEDTKTIELPIDKRGRGRPAKEDKLTQAERARRYRVKRKAEGIKSDVTENQRPLQSTWRTMVQQLEAENAELRAQLSAKNAQKKFEFSEFTRIEQKNEQLKKELRLTVSENEQLREQLQLAENERNAAFKRNAELELKMKLCDASQEITTELKNALKNCLTARVLKKRLSDEKAEAYTKLVN